MIPVNVEWNYNYFQTSNSNFINSSGSVGASSSSSGASSSSSGASSSWASSSSSGSSSGSSSDSDSGTSNSPGSNGVLMKAENSNRTGVKNIKVTDKGVTHGTIDEKTQKRANKALKNQVSGKKDGAGGSW